MSDGSERSEKRLILVADELSIEGLRLLESAPRCRVVVRPGLTSEQLAIEAREACAILVRSAARITREVILAAHQLQVIGRAGIGVDNVDVEAATERGVVVMNVPDANADTTAEHALALLAALARNIPAADRSVRSGLWDRARFVGSELDGKVLGILGAGNIGRRVARRALGLGMEVIVHDPFLPPDALRDMRVSVLPLEVVVAKADFITIHTPLRDSTRGLINAELIARMQDGVRIVNCARGAIVNETDLIAALRSGKVGGAALDVFDPEPPAKDHPFFSMDNVVLTPHLGASTAEAQTRASTEIARQVLQFLRHGDVKNAVNLPRVPLRVLKELAPWMDLGRRLGTFLGAILDGPCVRVEVSYQGKLAADDTSAVTRSVIAGLLQPAFEQTVNLVNALSLAEGRGIAVDERKSERLREFSSMVSATATLIRAGAEVTLSVSGTLFGHRQPRVTKIDDFHLEAIAEGTLLVIRNEDRPGVIGRMGTILGDHAINIHAMHLSAPRERDSHALMVLNISSASASPDASSDRQRADDARMNSAMAALRAMPEIARAEVVQIG